VQYPWVFESSPSLRADEARALERFLANDPVLARLARIEGPAGMGKTTLWHHACARAEQWRYRVLSASPAESEARLPFVGLGDVLGPVFDDVAPELEPILRRALGGALLRTDAGPDKIEPRAVAAATRMALEVMAGDAQVLVAVDDEQWLDPASARALSFGIRRGDPSRLRLLTTTRLTDVHQLSYLVDPRTPVEIQLGPLPERRIVALLSSSNGERFPTPLMWRIARASGGNPYFALKMASLAEHDRSDPTSADLPLPLDVESAVAKQLAQLRPEGRVVLEYASATEPISLTLLERVIGSDAELGVLEAIALGCLRADAGVLRFTHPLMASVVYQGMGEEDRRRVHGALSRSLANEDARVVHRARATVPPDQNMAEALAAAGQRTWKRGSPEIAVELFDQACSFSTASDRSIGWRIAASEASHVSGMLEEACERLASVTAELPDGSVRANALWRLGRVEFPHHAEAATDHLRSALQIGLEPSDRAEALYWLSSVEIHLGELAEAEADAGSAAKAARDARRSDLAAAATITQALAECWRGHGLDEELIADALAGPHHDDRFRVDEDPRFWRAVMLMYVDDLDEARDELSDLLDIAERHGDEPSAVSFLWTLAEVDHRAGRWLHALASLDDARMSIPSGPHLATRALLEACLGRTHEARLSARRSASLSEGRGDWYSKVYALWANGSAEFSAGSLEAARPYFDEAWSLLIEAGCGEPGLFPLVGDAAETLIALGSYVTAQGLVDWLEERGSSLLRPAVSASAARARALLALATGDHATAAGEAERAVVARRDVPTPLERGRDLLVLGAIQRKLRRGTEARTALMGARELFLGLGAQTWVARSEQELAKIGGRGPAPADLTQTEREIAKLVALGKRNREIATELFISVKTVESALRSTFRKLGIRSRVELATRFATGEEPPPDPQT
jgi:DNA-binding CsgD family transcriptional regulator